MVITEQSLSELIDRIYDVPLTPAGWSSVVPELEERLRARVAMFVQTPNTVSTLATCSASNPAMVELYEKRYWREDRAMTMLRAAPAGEIVHDSQLVSNRERRQVAFYRDYLAALDTHCGLYASVSSEGSSNLVVSAQRSAGIGDYHRSEADVLRRLAPHFQRSFRTWKRIQQLQEERQAAHDALAQLSVGMALIDSGGALHFANHAAQDRIGHGPLMLNAGRVTTRSSQSRQTFEAAIKAAAQPHGAAAERIGVQDSDGRPFRIHVSPFQRVESEPGHGRGLALMVIDGEEPAPFSQVAARRAYGLTPAEAQLFAALVNGTRIADYARQSGISVTTAKSHLGSLFDKVGVRRQADLIRRGISDPLTRCIDSK